MMPDTLREWVNKARAKASGKEKEPKAYVFAGKVLCKTCGTIIVEQGRPNDKYAIAQLLFNNESKHQTPLCKKCLNTPFSIEVLEAIYAVDLERMEQLETQADPMRWHHWMNRKPIAIEEVV